jgi:murein DD-endopeptidase MepM/ murein hydrolase activator NlpD
MSVSRLRRPGGTTPARQTWWHVISPPFTRHRTVGVIVGVIVGLAACLLGPTPASAFADRTATVRDGFSATSLRALDTPRDARPAAHHKAPQPHRVSRKPKPAHRQRHGTSGGHTAHGTDTSGGDGSTAVRDLALAATWQLDPALARPQPGDSAATLHARATLAAVADHIPVVLARYQKANATAQDAAATDVSTRAELKQARADAAAAHRVYGRYHRLLIQLVTTAYEEPPMTSMQLILSAHSMHGLMVVGTLQQVTRNQASVVTEAQAATVIMRETAARARSAADAARIANHRADAAFAAATRAGRKVLYQLDRARHALTLSVLADQMQLHLADAMQYANQLKPGSVSFPLPPHSGFYDNHNWGKHSRRWASFHTGDDYSVACGTPVLAATAGTIEVVTDQPWAGRWLVMLSTGQGKLTTWYAHMEALAVKAGQHVKPGQIIGRVGDEGNATGCHLHFELHPDGGSIYQDSTDPDPWLKAVGALPGN